MDGNRTTGEPEETPKLTPWQRMRVQRKVAEKLRADGRHHDADILESFARHSGQQTIVEGERRG